MRGPAARSAATRTTITSTSWRPVEKRDARRMSRKTPPTAFRKSMHRASRLSHQHNQAQADRRAVRLDEDHRRISQDATSRPWPRRGRVDRYSLQSRAHPQNSRRDRISHDGGSHMRRSHNKFHGPRADHHASSCLRPQRKSITLAKTGFSAACWLRAQYFSLGTHGSTLL